MGVAERRVMVVAGARKGSPVGGTRRRPDCLNRGAREVVRSDCACPVDRGLPDRARHRDIATRCRGGGRDGISDWRWLAPWQLRARRCPYRRLQRTALFEVTAQLPGVDTLSKASDRIGRRGVELRLVQHNPARTYSSECLGPNGSNTRKGSYREPASSTIEEAMFDPRTSTLLSLGTSYSPGFTPLQNPCFAMPKGTQMAAPTPSWTLLLHYGTAGSDSKTPS